MMIVFRIGLFAVATLAFVTLYDFGAADFPAHAAAEFQSFAGWLRGLTGH